MGDLADLLPFHDLGAETPGCPGEFKPDEARIDAAVLGLKRGTDDLGADPWEPAAQLRPVEQFQMQAVLPADRFEPLQLAHVLVVEGQRSEEHKSELQSLMRISSAVFCLHKKKTIHKKK